MSVYDFIIGMFLMNAMPHLVLGIWKGRMFSAFGFGNWQNIIYGVCCLVISVGMYVYKYGFTEIFENGIYFGALALLLIYFLTGKFWYKLFSRK